MPIIPPCKNCPNKGCGAMHNTCAPYLEYKAKKEQERQMKNKDHEVDNGLHDLRKNRVRVRKGDN